MNKKLTKVLAMFLCIVMSLPLGAFASLSIFAETETETATEATYTEPTLTNTTDVAYFSYAGNDTNNGLTPSTMKKYITAAFPLLTNGGRLVIPAKGYAGINTNVEPVSGTVLITAEDTDGTLYFDPANPDVDSAQKGMLMVAAQKTLTFNSDVILDNVVVLQRACSAVANAGNIEIANNSTMVIGANTRFLHCSSAAGGSAAVCNSKLTVAAGSTLIVKAAGALSYNGTGTIYLDKNLLGNGIDASQFSTFAGEVFDLDGNALCEIVGHSYAPTVVNHEYRYVCGSCGDDNGAYTYTTPVLENTTDAYYFANNGYQVGTETVYKLFTTLTEAMNAAENKGGTVYVTQKGYSKSLAIAYDVGAVSKFTAVLADGTDLREKNAAGETVSQNGALMWGTDTYATVVNFQSDVIFEKINFYSRCKTNTLAINNNTTALFNEVEFKRSSTAYPYTYIDVEAGSTVIFNDVSGKIGKITGYGVVVVDIDIVKSGVLTLSALENFNGIVMTTECKEICAFTGSHDYVDNVCAICGAEQGATTTKLYVKKNGDGDGLTPETPAGSIRTGFTLASADPIEIILVDDVLVSGGISCAATTQDVTITSMDLDGDGVYPKLIIQSYIHFKNEGSGNTITFKNIEIQSDRNTNVPLIFDFNNFVMGEGVTCTLSGNYEENYPIIYAGFNESAGADTAQAKTNAYNTVATIKSGTWAEVVGGSRRNLHTYAFGNNKGNMTVNVEGGTILGNVSGTGSNFYTGDININVSGGTIGGSIYGVGDLVGYGGAADYAEYGLKGDINIEVTGGTLAGGIYARYPMTAIPALIRGDVAVTLGALQLDNPITVDLRSTLAYTGKTQASYLDYDESLEGMVSAKFVDFVNGEETGAGEPRRVAFVGDSITQGTGSTNRALYSAPANIQTMLNTESPDTYMVGNFGVGASGVFETAGYFYNATLQYHLLMEEFEPEWVSFALGTNDCMTAGNSAGAALRFEHLYYELIKGVHDLPTVQKVYVNTPLIRFDYIVAWTRNVSVIEPAIKNVVNKLNANGYNATLVEMGAITAADTLAGNILGKDNLHPGDDGYVKLAQYYYDAIFNGKVSVSEGWYVDTIYLSTNGTRTGAGTLEDPISDIPLALWRLNKTGGEIVIVDQFTTVPYTKTTSKEVEKTVEKEVEKTVEKVDEQGNPVLDENGNPVTEIVKEIVTETVKETVQIVTEYPAYADLVTPADITGAITIKGNTADAVFEWRGKVFNFECDMVFEDLTLRTTFDNPYINAHFNSVTFAETFKTETVEDKGITFIGGYYAQADQSQTDTTAVKLYDTAESISSDKDVTFNFNGGEFAYVMLLNRRFDAKAPMGTYSGNMTVNFNGGKITGKSAETTVRNGAMTMCHLAGDMTVNFNGTEFDTFFYAISRTGTLVGVTNDSSLNTGSLVINAPATMLDGTIIPNQRTDKTDAQYTTIKKFTRNSTTLAGDINEDSEVNNADITLAVRYLSGFDVQGAKYSGDVNGDGKANNRDVIALIQKLNVAQ